MGYGSGRAEGITKQKGVIILDHSEDECIKKDEFNSDVCLRGQGAEVKKKENMKVSYILPSTNLKEHKIETPNRQERENKSGICCAIPRFSTHQ